MMRTTRLTKGSYGEELLQCGMIVACDDHSWSHHKKRFAGVINRASKTRMFDGWKMETVDEK